MQAVGTSTWCMLHRRRWSLAAAYLWHKGRYYSQGVIPLEDVSACPLLKNNGKLQMTAIGEQPA